MLSACRYSTRDSSKTEHSIVASAELMHICRSEFCARYSSRYSLEPHTISEHRSPPPHTHSQTLATWEESVTQLVNLLYKYRFINFTVRALLIHCLHYFAEQNIPQNHRFQRNCFCGYRTALNFCIPGTTATVTGKQSAQNQLDAVIIDFSKILRSII